MFSPANNTSYTKPVKRSKARYVSKQPGADGRIKYSAQENNTWSRLLARQQAIIKHKACDEFVDGLEKLDFNPDAIPQLFEINQKLQPLTGWQVVRVPALIGFERFFELLANRQFPAATFIRHPDEIDYIREPDIFHELFGHCPLLTNQDYADFSQHYGQLGLAANQADRAMLARLYWFTIEFGLVKQANDLKIYGGGILSSSQECDYSINSSIPQRMEMDVVECFRTFYRIDQLQKTYFVIEQLADLQRIIKLDLITFAQQARELGMRHSSCLPKESAAC